MFVLPPLVSSGTSFSGKNPSKYAHTGRVWAAGFHHIMAHSRLARGLKLMNRLFL
jgi:hypothetical protein